MRKELEKKFNKEFVRSDGLMDKYCYDKNGDIDVTANCIKTFIDKHFIAKEEVLEMIGMDKENSVARDFVGLIKLTKKELGYNQAKQEIRDKIK